MRPGDEAMVATYNRSLKVRAPFTRDPIQIQQTLDAIAGESALGIANRSEFKDVSSRINDAKSYDEALADARSYAQSVEHDLRQSVESINGLLTTRLAIPSFLVTLGTLSAARGLALMITNTKPVIITDETYFAVFGEGYFLGIPAPIAWTLAAMIVGILLLHYNIFGRRIYAAGGNSLSAQLDLERDLQRKAGGSADYREGVSAFLEKRKPKFTGQ
jgi:enoyl-CoA hydratase/carnithine racemase